MRNVFFMIARVLEDLIDEHHGLLVKIDHQRSLPYTTQWKHGTDGVIQHFYAKVNVNLLQLVYFQLGSVQTCGPPAVVAKVSCLNTLGERGMASVRVYDWMFVAMVS